MAKKRFDLTQSDKVGWKYKRIFFLFRSLDCYRATRLKRDSILVSDYVQLI